jgi:predicted transcriptional regulator
MKFTLKEIEYHAARLLILIAYCGSPAKSPAIKGRTLLAKFDFFLRYPAYLSKAAMIIEGKRLEELMADELKEYERENVETHMIRYKYGPWDNIYYPVIAYLIAKDLVRIYVKREVEYFSLTENGKKIAERISESSAFITLVTRAKALKKLFPNWNGARVKNFIYENFPEIISLPLGKEI